MVTFSMLKQSILFRRWGPGTSGLAVFLWGLAHELSWSRAIYLNVPYLRGLREKVL